jgi:tRNA-dihydrouridine synthase B
MRIGPLAIDPPVVLAPMSGIADRSFRLLCRQAGAGLVCTGMVSANALHYGSEKTVGLLAFDPHEHPVSAQVFGADPDRVAAAAAAAASRGADMVDINMGCAVPKVLKQRAGAALMADPERAEAILRAVVAAVGVPVSVKLRTGWRDRGEDAPALALRCQRAGAAAVTVHPRFASQRFRGSADWSVIARVKQAVRIPVIGSGDIHCAADAPRMIEETGCDAVMVGRAALGDPWIFAHIAAALAAAPAPAPPSLRERADLMARHLRLVVADRGERRGIPEMRKHFAWYLRGLPGARALREQVNRAAAQDQLMAVVNHIREGVAAAGPAR